MSAQFPFGFGLNYTDFEYSNLRLSAKEFKDVDGLEVSLEVANTGKLAGKEVVQIYVHDKQSRLVRPPKELKGFAKVDLQPGESKTVTVKLDSRAFAYYDPGYHTWVCEEGEFEILVGASSADIRLRETVTLHSTQNLPSILHQESTIKEWMEDKRGKVVFEPVFQQIVTSSRKAFGLSEDQTFIGMDLMGFLMDMPLRSVLGLQDHLLPTSPDEIVAGLLKQVHG